MDNPSLRDQNKHLVFDHSDMIEDDQRNDVYASFLDLFNPFLANKDEDVQRS